MYIQNFTIKNFRAIEDLTLTFNKGLNIFVGENNAGKTAIIDALRICIGYGLQKRDIYVSPADFFINKTDISSKQGEIEFHLTFSIEDPQEAGWYNDLLAVDAAGQQTLQFHLVYYLDDKRRVKWRAWGGSKQGQPIAPEILSLIFYVHLDALRDAEQHLRPIRGNRLGQLYSNIQIDKDPKVDFEKKSDLAKKVRSAVDGEADWQSHISTGKKSINDHLEKTSFAHKKQAIDVSFLPFDFNRLVDNLKIQLPIFDEALLNGDNTLQQHFELFQNGLGYNNLIYTATVLGDLKERKTTQKEGYAALLIEEPEAHLHPQLQNLFFSYLSQLEKQQGFQIFVSSHSPTITAKAHLETVIVLQNQNHKIKGLSLSTSGLSPTNRTYLHKFLDVTKSQLFFASAVILVEGIAEALLLPIMSQIMGGEYDIERSGVELVNINGVAFEHFANLYNNTDPLKNLSARCAVLTDDDREISTDEIASRAAEAQKLAAQNLKVYLAERTFEFELFLAGNDKILMEIFKEMHPNAHGKIVVDQDPKKYAANFLAKVISNKAKSELAHRLAVKLSESHEERAKFKVPQYIQDAIKYAVKG